ncbi:MAG: hypothetical protein B1H11_10810 [Desulfobacteraceae bacterium 4484_190.1]|nr:MAG: hypothetical protein B1H11_10810 [Desulfobacteraceae bacterium 4484_190.1]
MHLFSFKKRHTGAGRGPSAPDFGLGNAIFIPFHVLAELKTWKFPGKPINSTTKKHIGKNQKLRIGI